MTQNVLNGKHQHLNAGIVHFVGGGGAATVVVAFIGGFFSLSL